MFFVVDVKGIMGPVANEGACGFCYSLVSSCSVMFFQCVLSSKSPYIFISSLCSFIFLFVLSMSMSCILFVSQVFLCHLVSLSTFVSSRFLRFLFSFHLNTNQQSMPPRLGSQRVKNSSKTCWIPLGQHSVIFFRHRK